MQVAAWETMSRMLLPAAASLDRLVGLTSPGAPVAPVVAELTAVAQKLRDSRPAVEQGRLSAWLVGELARVQGAATTLRDSLAELAAVDGMTSFDPAFAADDPAWDAWFAESAALLRRADRIASRAEA